MERVGVVRQGVNTTIAGLGHIEWPVAVKRRRWVGLGIEWAESGT